MRRIILYTGTAFLAFVCGVLANSVVHKYFRSQILIVYSNARHSGLEMMPRFISEGSLLESDYHIYWYRTPSSDDPQEIILYADFRSAQVTHETFESNATSAAGAELIEMGSKLDGNGRKIGRRGVIMFKYVQAVRIFWTDRDTFWSVQAPSLELAREFEESALVHSITISNRRLQRTRQ